MFVPVAAASVASPRNNAFFIQGALTRPLGTNKH